MFLVVGCGLLSDRVKSAFECERRSVAGTIRVNALEGRLVEIFKCTIVEQLGNVVGIDGCVATFAIRRVFVVVSLVFTQKPFGGIVFRSFLGDPATVNSKTKRLASDEESEIGIFELRRRLSKFSVNRKDSRILKLNLIKFH